MTSIIELLHERYPASEGWICFEELQLDSSVWRRCDFLAVNTWSSRRHVAAFEVKVTKADFRRELDDPAKRAAFENLANEFSFVAPKGVIPLAEVPDGLGLLEVIGDPPKLRAARRAKQFKRDMPVDFMYRLLNRFRDQQACREADLKRNEWAQIAGKKIDFETLRRLGMRLWEVKNTIFIDHEVRKRVQDERKKARKELDLNRGRVWALLEGIVRRHLGRDRHYGSLTNEEIEAWLHACTAPEKASEVERRLREVAERTMKLAEELARD